MPHDYHNTQPRTVVRRPRRWSETFLDIARLCERQVGHSARPARSSLQAGWSPPAGRSRLPAELTANDTDIARPEQESPGRTTSAGLPTSARRSGFGRRSPPRSRRQLIDARAWSSPTPTDATSACGDHRRHREFALTARSSLVRIRDRPPNWRPRSRRRQTPALERPGIVTSICYA
jgi:hypothetical protein